MKQSFSAYDKHLSLKYTFSLLSSILSIFSSIFCFLLFCPYSHSLLSLSSVFVIFLSLFLILALLPLSTIVQWQPYSSPKFPQKDQWYSQHWDLPAECLQGEKNWMMIEIVCWELKTVPNGQGNKRGFWGSGISKFKFRRLKRLITLIEACASMEKGDLQAPMGYDGIDFRFRDMDRSKVQKKVEREVWRERLFLSRNKHWFFLKLCATKNAKSCIDTGVHAHKRLDLILQMKKKVGLD